MRTDGCQAGGLLGTQNYTASSIYDDALVIDAYLAERTAGGRARAQAIGNAMLSALAQAAPQGGGRYDEYAPAPLYRPADVQPASGSRTTGDAAWAGNALVQLYAATRVPSYVNSWSYLALQSPAYAGSVGWDVRNLASPLSAATPMSEQ